MYLIKGFVGATSVAMLCTMQAKGIAAEAAPTGVIHGGPK